MLKMAKKLFSSGNKITSKVNIGRNTCIVDGVRITGNYKSIVSKNGKIFLDGKEYIHENKDEKNITIIIQGDVDIIDVDEAKEIEIHGNVNKDVKTMSGDVVVKGNIHGMAKTMSGDIECQILKGNADTMSGDIIYKGR